MTAPQNERIKRKFALLRLFFPIRCLHESASQFAHIKETGLNGRGRGRNKRFWDILNNWRCYALLCSECHSALDAGLEVEIMTLEGLKKIRV